MKNNPEFFPSVNSHCAYPPELSAMFLYKSHSRPQSPSFLLVTWSWNEGFHSSVTKIKPSGSGDDNVKIRNTVSAKYDWQRIWVVSGWGASIVLLHQDITYWFYILVAIVWWTWSPVPTCVRVIGVSASTKTDPRVTRTTIISFITKDADSCSGMITVGTHGVKPFLVTVLLQGGVRTNQRLPSITA